MKTKLLIATRNPGKVKEYQDILAELPVTITWLEKEKINLEVAETGATFEENAILKAKAYAQASGLLTWADDSGLVVDALGGWPGVASARHAGPDAADADRVQILLEKLEGVPFDQRTAAFHCVVAIAMPDGVLKTTTGSSNGIIIEQPRGTDGFGYDPVFFVPEFECTYAELTPEGKHTISHRGRAAHQARELILAYLAAQT